MLVCILLTAVVSIDASGAASVVAPRVSAPSSASAAPSSLTWSAPTNITGNKYLTSVSCPSASFCMAVDTNDAYTWNGGSWSLPTDLDPGGFLGVFSVSCPSTLFCMAVGNGNVVTWDGGSWSAPTDSGLSGLNAVSCSSATFCAGVDGSLGHLYTWDGVAWSAPTSTVGPQGDDRVSCPSAGFCMAVDGNSAYRWNGVSWSHFTETTGDDYLQAVSCPSASYCVAFDAFGTVYTWNGAAWSAGVNIDSSSFGPKFSVSCPSASFCVAAGEGSVVTWNGVSWSAPTTIDTTSGDELVGVSCPSESFCAAVDDGGYAVTGTAGSPAPTVSVGDNSQDVAVGDDLTFTATVAGPVGNPTGTVTWTLTGPGSPTCADSTLSAGTATCTVDNAAAGTYTATANYLGDSNYAAASGADTAVVGAPSHSVLAGGESPDVLPTTCSCGKPVNTDTGEFWHTFNDLSVPGRGLALDFTRTYSTLAASTLGPLGYGWTDSYNMSLTFDGAGNATVHEPNSSAVTAAWTGSDYVFPSYVLATLTANGNGTFTFTRRDKSRDVFSATGALTQEIDRNGYVTTLGYDGSGRPATVTDPAGRTLTFAYGTNGLISSVTDPAGRVVAFDYDQGNNLADATDVAGNNWSFTYDADHLMLTMTDPRGGTTTNGYDGSGRVLSQSDPLDRTTTYAYSGAAGTGSGTTTLTDPNGGVTHYVYAGNELTTVTAGVGSGQPATTTYTYDPVVAGQTATTDPNGHTTTYTYDASGSVLTRDDALGHVTTYTYNDFNEPLTVTDPLGETTTYVYDSSGNLLSRSRPLGGTNELQATTYAYGDPHPGDVTASTDPDGHATDAVYDSDGNRTSTTDPNGHTTSATFDVDGRQLTSTTPNGHTTSYTYDAFGDVLTATDPLGHVTTNSYDEDQNLVSTTDASGHVTAYTYDADNEKTSTVEPNGATSSSAYDANGNAVSTTDANGHVTANAYDVFNRLVSTTDPLGHTTHYGYDPAGNRIHEGDAAGRVTTSGYDAANELVSLSYSDGTTPNVTYTYDNDGRRSHMHDGTGTTTYVYDTLGRMTSSTDGAGATVAHGYDLASYPISLTYPNGQTVTQSYDAAGNLVSVKDWLDHTTTFSYDGDNNVSAQVVPSSPTVTDTSTYDANDQLASVADTQGPATLQSFDYTRTALGLVSAASPSGSATINYAYDTVNHLTQDAQGSYASDPAGNLTGFNGTAQAFNAGDQLTGSGAGSHAISFGDNAVGDRTTSAAITGLATGYTYDQAHRLAGIGSYTVLPAVSSLSPKTGAVGGGTTVTINGTGFTGVTSVQFGGHAASHVTIVSDRKVTAAAPAGLGTINVTLTRSVGTSLRVTADHFTYSGGPAISAVTPSWVGTKASPSITVTGVGFTGTKTVSFGSAKSPRIKVVSSTKLYAAAPPGTGRVDVRVTTSKGTSALVAEDRFAYQRVTPTVGRLTPSSGPAGAHTIVTIFGKGLSTAKAVHFGTLAASSFTVHSDDVVTAVSPTGSGLVGVTVTTDEGTTAKSDADHFTYRASTTPIASYSYNGDGIRTSKHVGSATTTFAWDTVGATPMLLHDSSASYIYGPGGLPIESIDDGTGAVSYYHHDQLGSTTMLTSAAGAVRAKYTYGSFGKVLSGSLSATPVLYAGQYRDTESGLYYLRARYYDPATAQFLSVDPALAITGQPYAYANGDPLNTIDPTGECGGWLDTWAQKNLTGDWWSAYRFTFVDTAVSEEAQINVESQRLFGFALFSLGNAGGAQELGNFAASTAADKAIGSIPVVGAPLNAVHGIAEIQQDFRDQKPVSGAANAAALLFPPLAGPVQAAKSTQLLDAGDVGFGNGINYIQGATKNIGNAHLQGQ